MDNAHVKQSTGAAQAWLFIVLLGPPLGAVIPLFLMLMIRIFDPNVSLLKISIIDIVYFMAVAVFSSIFSYFMGGLQAIVFASLIAFRLIQRKWISWLEIFLAALAASLISVCIFALIFDDDSERALYMSGMFALCYFSSALLCRFVIASLGIMPPRPGHEYSARVKRASYAILVVFIVSILAGGVIAVIEKGKAPRKTPNERSPTLLIAIDHFRLSKNPLTSRA
ncbi:MAG: hypothetical protein SGJ17_15260 [Hyphomicrobiales bacterium]|nr:hypothetical protein [Hyphomicrobiales bacterium]